MSVMGLIPGKVYRFKAAIADVADASLDSAVFINKIRSITAESTCLGSSAGPRFF